MTNPFAQAQALTELLWICPEAQALQLEAALEDLCLAQSRFIVDEAANVWRVRLLADAPSVPEIVERVARLQMPPPQTAHVAARDWVGEVQASFVPIRAGRFFVHGSHIDRVPQAGALAIRMDAGAAFGTGEHETTSLCLLALDALARRRRVVRALDMGCGSGILAIGAARLWPARVEAVDNDAMSVQVAKENMVLNGVARQVHCMTGDGYRAVRGDYDLILANILARPLMRMAGDLAAHLAPGGVAVLSGLLVRQEPMVLWAHRQHGLRLIRRLRRNGWSALIVTT